MMMNKEFYIKNEEGHSVAVCLTEKLGEGTFSETYRAVIRGVTGTLRKINRHRNNPKALRAYKILKDLCMKNNFVKGFVPNFEFFVDEKNENEKNEYIFCSDAKLITFEEICARIKSGNDYEANSFLVSIIGGLKNLTECLVCLHKSGLIHRDLNPSNFGFRISVQGEILVETISLFDVDSICEVYASDEEFVGTEGFSEFSSGCATNLDDIYSVGANLFYALIGRLYTTPRDFDDLEDLVNKSSLLNRCSTNLHPNLTLLLTHILQRTLCSRTRRYPNCEALLKDIELAYYYAIPAELAVRDSKTWKEIHDFFDFFNKDKGKVKNFSSSILYHLWTHPLYTNKKSDDPNLNILVIGFGAYAQCFLDYTLALGQMPNTNLNVHIVSNNLIDFESYLDKRPALKDFFQIFIEDKRNFVDERESYGNIYGYRVNAETINQKFLQSLKTHYAFIALGDDEKNLDTAKNLSDILKVANIACDVNFVWTGSTMSQNCGTAIPVSVNAQPSSQHSKTLERIAFNAHLLWQKNLQIDWESTRREFHEAYNHSSSLLTAVHLRYKLHSLGINWNDDCLSMSMAQQFEKLKLEKPNIIDALIAAEHRKWCCEKIFDGYTQMDVSSCNGSTKDKKKRRHVCLVKSTEGRPLQNLSLAEWDNMTKAELEKLDELDRVSIEMHRFYCRQAAEIKKNNILTNENLVDLREMIATDKTSLLALEEWLSCLKDLWNGTVTGTNPRRKAYIYEGLKIKLEEAISKSRLPTKVRELCKQKIGTMHQYFRFIVESMKYYDLKNEDTQIVLSTSYLLTFNEDIMFAVQYQNNAVLENIAACAIVNPKTLVLVMQINSRGAYEKFKNSLSENFNAMISFCEQRKLRTHFEIMICCTDNSIDIHKREVFQKILLKFSRVKKVKWVKDIKQYLTRKGGNNFFVEHSLDVEGVMPSFKFDIDTQSFDIAPLSFIHTKQDFLTVAEAFALNNAVIVRQDNPEFFDEYRTLWSLYCQNKAAWMDLCSITSSKSRLLLATFQKNAYDDSTAFEYILPAECRAAVEKILYALKKESIISESRVTSATTTAIKIYITAPENLCGKFDSLFSEQIYALMRPTDMRINHVDGKIDISFNSLHLENINFENNPKLILLLEHLKKLHYIVGLKKFSDHTVSFTYATREIKNLFTAKNRVKQAYCYHQALSDGIFDDIACDVACHSAGQNVTFDIVATKGFQTFLINFSNFDEKNFSKLQDDLKNVRIINAENVDVDLLLASF